MSYFHNHVLPVNWAPENPLGLHGPMKTIGYPAVNFEQGGIFDKDLLQDSESLQSGVYAWIVYGVLACVHWSYYADRYYWTYIVNKHWNLHLAWRTWFGVSTWLRDFLKVSTWGITGMVWMLSLYPEGIFLQYFATVTTYLLMVETFTVFIITLMRMISFFAYDDLYENAHQEYLNFDRA